MKKSLFVVVLVALFGAMIKPAQAHVLVTDKSIGAVLHIDPDDDPAAGAPSSFYLELKDKENKFQPQNCDCTFNVIENNKQIYSQPLFHNATDPNSSNATVSFTFPKKDVYQVKVVGHPLTPNAFQPFTLTYDIRVSREAQATSNSSSTDSWIAGHVIHLVGAIGIALFLIISLILHRKNK